MHLTNIKLAFFNVEAGLNHIDGCIESVAELFWLRDDENTSHIVFRKNGEIILKSDDPDKGVYDLSMDISVFLKNDFKKIPLEIIKGMIDSQGEDSSGVIDACDDEAAGDVIFIDIEKNDFLESDREMQTIAATFNFFENEFAYNNGALSDNYGLVDLDQIKIAYTEEEADRDRMIFHVRPVLAYLNRVNLFS